MSIYEEKIKNKNTIKDKKTIFLVVGVVLTILVLIVIISSVIKVVPKANNLSIKFNKNPYNITKDKELQIITTIKNNTNKDIENASITIYPIENIFYVTCENSELQNNRVVVPIISEKATRTIVCSLKTNPEIQENDIISGTYSFDVVYTLDNEEYNKRAILKLKK